MRPGGLLLLTSWHGLEEESSFTKHKARHQRENQKKDPRYRTSIISVAEENQRGAFPSCVLRLLLLGDTAGKYSLCSLAV